MSINGTSIILLGGNGMLGTDIQKICSQHSFNINVLDLPEFAHYLYARESRLRLSPLLVSCSSLNGQPVLLIIRI